jgi:hypothetical protein
MDKMFRLVNLKEIDYLGHLGVDRRIILKRALEKQNARMQTGLVSSTV